MKKFAKSQIAFVLALTLTLVSLVSCGLFGYDTVDVDYTVTLVIKGDDTVYTYKATEEKTLDNGLFSLLDALDIEYSESSGMFYSVGKLAPEPPEYIYIYTSVAADADVSTYKQEMTYDGKTLTSSGVGAKDMTFEDGAIIYIGTISYE